MLACEGEPGDEAISFTDHTGPIEVYSVVVGHVVAFNGIGNFGVSTLFEC